MSPWKRGRVHSYSLEQFGLSAADQRKRYQAYCARVDIPPEGCAASKRLAV